MIWAMKKGVITTETKITCAINMILHFQYSLQNSYYWPRKKKTTNALGIIRLWEHDFKPMYACPRTPDRAHEGTSVRRVAINVLEIWNCCL